MSTPAPIGIMLDGQHVVCLPCGDNDPEFGTSRSYLYPVNVDRYGQHCHTCGRSVNEGQTGWPELFQRKGCLLCDPTQPCSLCFVPAHAPARCLDPMSCPCACGDDTRAAALEERGLFV